LTAEFVSGVIGDTPFEFRRPAWQARAACHPDVMPPVWMEWADNPTAFFFPGRGIPPRHQAAIASLCGSCPVREECGTWGTLHEQFGYWGGLSGRGLRERRREEGITAVTVELDGGRTMGTFIPPGHGTEERYQVHYREGSVTCEACRDAHREFVKPRTRRIWDEKRRNETPEMRENRLATARADRKNHHRA
jgi:hypothetical protein